MNRGKCVSVWILAGGAFSFQPQLLPRSSSRTQLQVDYAHSGIMKSGIYCRLLHWISFPETRSSYSCRDVTGLIALCFLGVFVDWTPPTQKWSADLTLETQTYTFWCQGVWRTFIQNQWSRLKHWTTEETETQTAFFFFSIFLLTNTPPTAAALNLLQLLSFLSVVLILMFHSKGSSTEETTEWSVFDLKLRLCPEQGRAGASSSTFISISGTKKFQIWRREEAELCVLCLQSCWDIFKSTYDLFPLYNQIRLINISLQCVQYANTHRRRFSWH